MLPEESGRSPHNYGKQTATKLSFQQNLIFEDEEIHVAVIKNFDNDQFKAKSPAKRATEYKPKVI